MKPEILVHVAKIARLQLSEQEVQELLPQLQEILEYFAKIKNVESDDAAPSLIPVKVIPDDRKDTAEVCLSQDVALRNTQTKNGYFRGPKAI